jgi:hypothetical protein
VTGTASGTGLDFSGWLLTGIVIVAVIVATVGVVTALRHRGVHTPAQALG